MYFYGVKPLRVLRRRAKLYGAMKPVTRMRRKILIVLRIAFPNRDFDHTLHPIDLSILPMVIRPEQTLPHSVRFPNQRKTLWPRLDLASFPRLFGALETVLYKNRVD